MGDVALPSLPAVVSSLAHAATSVATATMQERRRIPRFVAAPDGERVSAASQYLLAVPASSGDQQSDAQAA